MSTQSQPTQSQPTNVLKLAVLICIVFSVSSPAANAHDIPDGTVKIANQVTVKYGAATIQYDVGFSPETLKMVLTDLDKTKLSDKYEENLNTFRELFKKKIESTLTVEMDAIKVEAAEIVVEPQEISKHVQARFTLQYTNPNKGDLSFSVSDSSFTNQNRLYSSGFKARGAMAVVESSTKEIPIRSKPTEKPAEEPTPFVIYGKVKSLDTSEPTSVTGGASGPLFLLALALGGAGFVGFLLVPNDLSDGHDDHH